MAETRDAHLGRLNFLSIYDDVQHSLGDAMETAGRVPILGEPRPNPITVSFPVYPGAGESETESQRLRRQVLGLLSNKAARSFLWFGFDEDHEIDAWLAVGGATLDEVDGGTTFSRWKLTLSDSFVVGRPAHFRGARRCTTTELRLITSARDYLQTIYSTDFAVLGGGSVFHYLPANVRDVVGVGRVPVQAYPVPTLGGTIYVVNSTPDQGILSYEQDPAYRHTLADVIIYDRRGSLVSGNTPFIDTFAVDDLGLWQYREGSSGFTISGGTLNSGATTQGIFRPDIATVDQEMVAKVIPGTTTGVNAPALLLRGQTGTNPDQILIQLDCTGTSAILEIQRRIGGSFTMMNSAGSFTVANGTPVWVRGIVVGDVVTAELWTTDPALGGSASRSISANVAAFSTLRGYGNPGLRVNLSQTNWKIDEVRVNPSDPSVPIAWEEVYGPNQPLYNQDAQYNDVPVMANGICRVRYDTVTGTFILDTVVGTGYAEQGRIEILRNDSFWGALFFSPAGATSIKARVVEWSPERSVVQISGPHPMFSNLPRFQVYVTLQRGWSGPRFDVYTTQAAGDPDGTPVLRYIPIGTRPSIISPGFTSDLGEATGTTLASSFTGQPGWTAIASSDVTAPVVSMHVLQEGVTVLTRDDTAAYPTATRKAIELRPTSATMDWLAVTFGTHATFDASNANAAIPAMFEAEVYRNTGSGTTSQVADGAAINGQAVKETQTAQSNATLISSTPPLPTGLYALWLRVKVADAGNTFSMVFRPDQTNTSAAATATNTAWAWVKVAETLRTVGTTLQVNLWRSAGVGANGILIDRGALVPVERRTTIITGGAGNDYNGVQDVSGRNRRDNRQVPALQER